MSLKARGPRVLARLHGCLPVRHVFGAVVARRQGATADVPVLAAPKRARPRPGLGQQQLRAPLSLELHGPEAADPPSTRTAVVASDWDFCHISCFVHSTLQMSNSWSPSIPSSRAGSTRLFLTGTIDVGSRLKCGHTKSLRRLGRACGVRDNGHTCCSSVQQRACQAVELVAQHHLTDAFTRSFVEIGQL